jgi:hypothetical protein
LSLKETIWVYDLEELEETKGHYSFLLPENDEERSECILAALPINVDALVGPLIEEQK